MSIPAIWHREDVLWNLWQRGTAYPPPLSRSVGNQGIRDLPVVTVLPTAKIAFISERERLIPQRWNKKWHAVPAV